MIQLNGDKWFSLWCTKLLASLVRRCGQKVTLVKTWVNYTPRKGVKLKIAILQSLLLLVPVRLAYLTNCSTDKHETW